MGETPSVPAGGAPPGSRRGAIVRVKLPCANLDEVRARYPELKDLRFRLRTREQRAAGTRVRLEALLAGGAPCFTAYAIVESVTTGADGQPGAWTLRLAALDDAGQELVAWMGGQPPLGRMDDAPATTPASPFPAVAAPAPTPPPTPALTPPPLRDRAWTAVPATPAATPAKPVAAVPPPLPRKTATSTPTSTSTSPATPAPVSTSDFAEVSSRVLGSAQRRPEAPPRPPPPVPRPPPSAGPVVEPDVVPEAKPVELGSRIIGIDLGTTNSAAAVVKGGKPFIIPSREGYSTIPSVVALSDKGSLIVGHVARDRLLVNPRGTVHGAKRLIGRQFHSPVVRDLAGRFSYEIVAGPRGEAAVKLGDKIFSLQKISAMVLAQVKGLAEQWLGEEVHRAVITVPAYYNDNQRQAVRAAGALAGLQVERIVNEPTAAALAFAHGRKVEQRVLVYDLGGGTFDTSVLELHGNVYEVIATGGDTFLGGVDFDKALLDELMGRFKAQHGVDFAGDRVAFQRIAEAAERAKVALSERLSTQVNLPYVTAVGSQAYALQATVTRAELEGLTRHLVERTLRVCDDVLCNAGLKPSDIGEVLLVGGQSRMPLVRSLIREFFGKEPCKSVHADEAVALGAAILADSLMTSEADAPVLLDVLPMSIGIGQPGGRFKRVIERNTTLPCRRTHSIWTSAQQGRTLAIPVFQGESERAQENEYLGTLLVADLPPGLDGDVVFDVTFTLSTESILTVTAEERGTARSVTATFSTQATPETVRQRIEEAPSEAAAPPPPAAPAPPLPDETSFAGLAGEPAAAGGPGDLPVLGEDPTPMAPPPRRKVVSDVDAATLPPLWDEPTAQIEPTQTGLTPAPRPVEAPPRRAWTSPRMAEGNVRREQAPAPGPLARLAGWLRGRGRGKDEDRPEAR